MEIGSLEDIAKAWDGIDVDHTDNGKCTGCGDCCGRLLPLSDKEVRQLKNYVRQNKIKPIRHDALIAAEQVMDMTCPFLDMSKPDKRCTIYKHRPLICRLYKCNGDTDKTAEKVFWKSKHYVADMMEIFKDD